ARSSFARFTSDPWCPRDPPSPFFAFEKIALELEAETGAAHMGGPASIGVAAVQNNGCSELEPVRHGDAHGALALEEATIDANRGLARRRGSHSDAHGGRRRNPAPFLGLDVGNRGRKGADLRLQARHPGLEATPHGVELTHIDGISRIDARRDI